MQSSWALTPFGYLWVHNLPHFFWNCVFKQHRLFSVIKYWRYVPISICWLMVSKFVVFTLSYRGIHVSSYHKYIVFRYLWDKWREFIIERGCLIFITDICWTETRNYGCTVIAIESGNYQSWTNFLNAIHWLECRWTKKLTMPPIVELVEFFHVEADMKVQPFPMSWYSRYRSLWKKQCCWTHMVSMLYVAAETTSSENWLILDSVRTLKVEIVMMRLHLRSRCFGSVAVVVFLSWHHH